MTFEQAAIIAGVNFVAGVYVGARFLFWADRVRYWRR